MDSGQAYWPICCRGHGVRGNPFNPNEEHMGSTTIGMVNLTSMIGRAMPQNIKIDRAGLSRVRMVVAPR